MRKQIVLDIDADLYDGVCGLEGAENVSRYLEKLIRLHLPHPDLDQGYQEMAADVEREREALEWAEATCGDGIDEER